MVTQEKKYEIGILEIRRHIPVLYTFMKVCKINKTNVTIFTTKDLYSRLESYDFDLKQFNFIIKKDRESLSTFLKRVQNICNKNIDLLFVNTVYETIYDLILYLNFNPNSKKVLVVHHVNSWLRPKLYLNLFHPIRTFNTNISSALIKSFIFPKFDAIDVIYKPMKDYIEKNIEFDKPVFTIPTSVFEGKFKIIDKINDDKIRIVIPGLLQEHRKDFTHVYPAIEKIFNKYKNKIILHVLGMPVGRFGRIVCKRFKDLEKNGNKVVIFEEFVPDDVFDQILKESDIILSPIRIKTKAEGDIKEEYGKTVGSGVIYNAIMYTKPIIVPAAFNMLKEFSSSSLSYKDSKELELILNQIINDNSRLDNLKDNALINSKKYSLESFQQYFKNKILKWLESN